MAKPKRAIPSIPKNICLPEPIVRRVDLVLFSPLEGRVPHGAWSRFITIALEEKLQCMDANKKEQETQTSHEH